MVPPAQEEANALLNWSSDAFQVWPGLTSHTERSACVSAADEGTLLG